MVYCNTALSAAAFALVVSGQSMEPDFFSGDRIFVDPDVTPAPGDIVVARVVDDLILRKYRPLSDSARVFELVPRHPDYMIVRSPDAAIVGVVVEHHRFRAARAARY